MKLTVLAVSLALACAFTSAEARPRNASHHFIHQSNVMGLYVMGCSDPVMKPCLTREPQTRLRLTKRERLSTRSAPSQHLGWDGSISRPARYIAGRLVCAVNVNAELARRGIRGTGSALAKSFLHWGRASRPVAGAVAVYGRRGGGHVAIVSRVVNGRVYVWNPSSRKHQWREVEYRKRAISYRVAAQ